MDYFTLIAFILVLPAVLAGVEQCPETLSRNRNLKLYGSSCYEFVLSHPVDWSHADGDCKRKGGYLVDIHSFGENYFIYKTLRELGYLTDEGVWIGLTDRERESNWHWSNTRTSLNYKNWASGQPGLLGTFEDCAILQASDGKWHDYPCTGFLFTSQKHGWVCKYAAAAPLTTIKPLVVTSFTVNPVTGFKMTNGPDTATDSMATDSMATDSMNLDSFTES